jgi:glutathione-regulated potassium-efflux system protein KefB
LIGPTCARGAALRAGSVLTGAGEFAFVLIPLGGTLGVLGERQTGILSAIASTAIPR